MSQPETATPRTTAATVFPILGMVSFCHLLNDAMQSLLPATYPLFKHGYNLSFGQIGLLTLAYQLTASLLQPLVGIYGDRRPRPYALPFGMGASLLGLLILSMAPSYAWLLVGAAVLGTGSSIFHPESSRVARLASGGAHGLAQSLFQVGGNVGSALGPLLAAFIVLPQGQHSLAWFALVALLGIGLLTIIGRWYQTAQHKPGHARHRAEAATGLSRKQLAGALSVLIALVFSKYFYLASISSYYIFYLMHHFHLAPIAAQEYLFVFLAAVAVGTIVGGPVGDRIGRKTVIQVSILGVLPFTLLLPYAGLTATVGLSIIIGLILSSAFSAIVVYAQELMPGRIGMVSGLFFGLSFGMGGLGAAVLGELADHAGIDFVYKLCSLLPTLGILAMWLPELRPAKKAAWVA